MFEVSETDLAGRIGTLHTNHGTVTTPAYVPVIHPVRQAVPAATVRSMGFEMVITNAYITKNRYGAEAEERGIHDVIGFEGPVMTDSGGYQVLEYGGVDVSPPEMAAFERGIMTDVAIPLDRPTGLGMRRADAEEYVRHTLDVSAATLRAAEDNGQVWVGPVQGGEHLDLVAESARRLAGMGFGMMALGSPVEVMESYGYALLARMIVAARRNMPHSVPLHLFGAGHPLTIPLAVALGCDTFDSASYMLYARQGRYITPDGTRVLAEMGSLPCSCGTCASHTQRELAGAGDAERTALLAAHNLAAIGLEVERTREAIREGRLWEHVMQKARAHPRLYEAAGVLTGNSGFLAQGTPRFKRRAVFLYGSEDQFRPEVQAFHGMARRFRTDKSRLLITGDTQDKPAYRSRRYSELAGTRDLGEFQVCMYGPHLGIIPVELSDVFPAAHHEAARLEFDPRDYGEFARTWGMFFANNAFSEVHYDRDDAFLRHFIKMLPRNIRRIQIK